MEVVDQKREVNASVTVLGEESRTSASLLHSALIATAQGAALTVVRRAGSGEGLEAWRLLVRKYEPRTKQTKVVRLLEVLNTSIQGPDILDALERFEESITEYEKEAKKTFDDDIKIGVVIRALEDGPLKEHLLLHSERCDSYTEFREELETIARAKSAGTSHTLMDIGALGKGNGKGPQKFQGTCHNCGKPGHKASECRAPGGGAAAGAKGSGKKGGGKPGGAGRALGGKGGSQPQVKRCHLCGMTNHLAKDCRASEEKKRKWKASQSKKGLHELDDIPEEQIGDAGDMGQFDFCQLCAVAESDRTDSSDREITFAVDSAACRTVMNKDHKAARGYKVWRDKLYGQTCGTAMNNGPRIHDEGLRVLQTQGNGMDPPMRLHTRKANVRKPLIAVSDMVDHNHAVFFDSSGSYALNKRTGRKTPFERKGRGWDLKLVLEAPTKANSVMAGMLAELRGEQEKEQPPLIELNVRCPEMNPKEEPGFPWAARLGRAQGRPMSLRPTLS